MKLVATTGLAAVLGAAALAGAGFGGVRATAAAPQAGAFGGRVAHVHVRPLWHERSHTAAAPLHRVRCATAALGDTSSCWA